MVTVTATDVFDDCPDVEMLASANRVLPFVELVTVTRVASAVLILSTRSVSARASSADSKGALTTSSRC
jgi:hypothetical protein